MEYLGFTYKYRYIYIHTHIYITKDFYGNILVIWWDTSAYPIILPVYEGPGLVQKIHEIDPMREQLHPILGFSKGTWTNIIPTSMGSQHDLHRFTVVNKLSARLKIKAGIKVNRDVLEER